MRGQTDPAIARAIAEGRGGRSIPETIALKELNAAKTADSVDALAAAMGVDPAALASTLDEARAAQAAGRADRLGRAWGGDAPPAPPFRALKVRGALYHTQGGLQIDGEARVLRPDGSRLPNLFAGGGAAPRRPALRQPC